MIERELQTYVNKDLEKLGIKYLHLEAGGGTRNRTHRKGWLDLLIFPGRGKTFFVELKVPGKKMTEDQVLFSQWATSMQYPSYCVHSVEEWEVVKRIERLGDNK